MFKVIRDFVEKPRFMLICDRACGNYAFVEIPDGPRQNEDAHQAIWAQSLQQTGGWKITMAEHICPAHVKQDAEGKSLIAIPNMAAARGSN